MFDFSESLSKNFQTGQIYKLNKHYFLFLTFISTLLLFGCSSTPKKVESIAKAEDYSITEKMVLEQSDTYYQLFNKVPFEESKKNKSVKQTTKTQTINTGSKIVETTLEEKNVIQDSALLLASFIKEDGFYIAVLGSYWSFLVPNDNESLNKAVISSEPLFAPKVYVGYYFEEWLGRLRISSSISDKVKSGDIISITSSGDVSDQKFYTSSSKMLELGLDFGVLHNPLTDITFLYSLGLTYFSHNVDVKISDNKNSIKNSMTNNLSLSSGAVSLGLEGIYSFSLFEKTLDFTAGAGFHYFLSGTYEYGNNTEKVLFDGTNNVTRSFIFSGYIGLGYRT